MVHWQIRKLEKTEDFKLVPGRLVAKVTAADGSGRLTIHDPAYEEILKELFEREQFVLMYADDEDGISSDGGEVFPAWHPQSLDYARSALSHYLLTAVEVEDEPIDPGG